MIHIEINNQSYPVIEIPHPNGGVILIARESLKEVLSTNGYEKSQNSKKQLFSFVNESLFIMLSNMVETAKSDAVTNR